MVNNWKKVISKHSTVRFTIVDNSSGTNIYPTTANCTYIPLFENKGIAYAQNRGIECFLKEGNDFIVFFDQDSLVPDCFFKMMMLEYKKIKVDVPNLAMLGPTITNQDTNENYKTKGEYVSTDYALTSSLISSGTITEIKLFKEVGFMDDSLFIDGVDFEWCWRAARKGYICARTQNVTLYHKIGQRYLHFLGYPIIVSSPIRYFYQYRNLLILLKREYVPVSWKIKSIIRRFVELFIVPFYAEKKIQTLCQMLKGIQVGLFKC